MPSEFDIRKSLAPAFGGERFGEDTAEYLFGRIKRLRLAFIAEHPSTTVLDFGIGEPYNGPDRIIREAIACAARDKRFDGYPDLGLEFFHQAVVDHLQKVFRISADAIGLTSKDNVQDCWGIKPALDALAKVFCAPGDGSWPDPRIQVAVTAPGYPVFGTQAAKLGAEVIKLPVTEENGYVPDLSVLENAENLHAIYLISPHNPTGRAYDTIQSWWEAVIAFCRHRSVALVVDEAYAHLRWVDEEKPFTVLSVPGFTEVGVALQSCSKTFDWTGGRVGMVVGNEWIVRAFRKEYEDSSSGQTKALQWAAAQALTNFDLIVPGIRADYRKRMQALTGVLKGAGFSAEMPDGGFFVYCGTPKSCIGGRKFQDAEAFMQYMLNEHGVVSVPFGDRIRFASTIKVGEEGQPATFEQAIDMLAERLPKDLVFT